VKLGSVHFRYALLLVVQTCAVVLVLAGLELKFIYADRPVQLPFRWRQGRRQHGPRLRGVLLAAQATALSSEIMHACQISFHSGHQSGAQCAVCYSRLALTTLARQGKARDLVQFHPSVGWNALRPIGRRGLRDTHALPFFVFTPARMAAASRARSVGRMARAESCRQVNGGRTSPENCNHARVRRCLRVSPLFVFFFGELAGTLHVLLSKGHKKKTRGPPYGTGYQFTDLHLE
jgi:hypothetical protein